MSGRRVDVIVSCSSRKTQPIDETRRLRAYAELPFAERVDRWREARDASGDRIAARRLYAGDHWLAARSAIDLMRTAGTRGRMWIASAGWGLVAEDEPIAPYSATFASREPDSIWRGEADGPRKDALRAWWRTLTQRRVAAVTADVDSVLLVAGASYLEALAHDISDLASRVVIICPGSDHPCALRFDASLRPAVGGTLSSLASRALGILASSAANHAWEREAMQCVLDERQPVPMCAGQKARVPATDDVLIDALAELREAEPALSRSRALALVRASGLQCSQERLARLFDEGSV
jgi:hypothetical protein